MTVRLERPADREEHLKPPRLSRVDAPRLRRRQLPGYSPLSLSALARGAMAAIRSSEDARPGLASLLRQTYQADAVVLTGSGTQALELAIRTAWGLAGPAAPSVVAIPAFNCYDVATAAVGSGLSIALYDVDPATLAPDLDSLRAVLEGGVRIVVVAHLYGLPVDWQALEDCVAPFGAILIEDAAQGHGAGWRQRSLGTLAPLSVLSFGRGKGWTGSRGGALLLRGAIQGSAPVPGASTGSEEIGTTLTAAAQWWLGRPSWYWLPASIPWLALGETRYHGPGPVRSMTRASATMICHTRPLAVLEMFARRSNARDLLGRIPESEALRPVRPHRDGEAGFLRLPLRLSTGWNGFADPEHALRLGIAGSYPTTLDKLPAVKERLVGPQAGWPGGETLVRELVTLPTHSLVTAADRDAIVSLIQSASGRTPRA